MEELYKYCKIAREILQGDFAVGRVIARPFEGEHLFKRTARRHDYSLVPPRNTMFDVLKENGLDTIGVGKIFDIFAGKSVSDCDRRIGNAVDMEATSDYQQKDFHGLCFTNLVDFDALWGHRRNPVGYGEEIERFDEKLGELMGVLRDDDLLILTADHGNDPTYTGTDHTRETVPMLAWSPSMKGAGLLKSQEAFHTFAVLGATIADNFGVGMPEGTIGTSILEQLR